MSVFSAHASGVRCGASQASRSRSTPLHAPAGTPTGRASHGRAAQPAAHRRFRAVQAPGDAAGTCAVGLGHQRISDHLGGVGPLDGQLGGQQDPTATAALVLRRETQPIKDFVRSSGSDFVRSSSSPTDRHEAAGRLRQSGCPRRLLSRPRAECSEVGPSPLSAARLQRRPSPVGPSRPAPGEWAHPSVGGCDGDR